MLHYTSIYFLVFFLLGTVSGGAGGVGTPVRACFIVCSLSAATCFMACS